MQTLYEKLSRESIEVFDSVVKTPLQNLLNGKIFSVESEAQTSSLVSKVLDQSTSSDLIVKYQSTNLVYMAGSRISKKSLEECKYPISITLRNSISGYYEKTELNKLYLASQQFKKGVPVIIPRYLCFARVFSEDTVYKLYDIIAVETLPLIENIFDSAKLNISKLRKEMLSEKQEKILFDNNLKSLAGISTNNSDKNKITTFLFLSKKYLDINAIPYLYKNISMPAIEETQVEFQKFTTEKIVATSRYNIDKEVMAVESAKKLLEQCYVDHLVKKIFFDSKVGICDIEISDEPRPTEDQKARIFSVLCDALPAFWWEGVAVYGRNLLEGMEADQSIVESGFEDYTIQIEWDLDLDPNYEAAVIDLERKITDEFEGVSCDFDINERVAHGNIIVYGPDNKVCEEIKKKAESIFNRS